ncbi:DUF1175 family protein [Brevibacillus fluminis]|uniref:Probable endopeptidase p60 n=1 Tax=Brevibacillus fluminis TaxID=511487 RepID=A0A3M8D8Z6_9BACL|nr:NlpC/P60 family protein [Brevibacillus fluminis]RNB84514.1 DUF1175 family protein [Brevibacillus fluminis]
MLNRKTTLLSLTTLVLLLPVTPASASTYTVVKGDSLFQIAKKYQTSTDELMHMNRLNSDNLQIGQTLEVGNKPAIGGQPAAGQEKPPADIAADQPAKPAKPDADQPKPPKQMKVNADILNVRSAPDIDSKIVDKLSFGTTVHIVDYGQEWTRISYKDIEGFVATQFLSVKSASGDTAAVTPSKMDADKLQDIIAPLMKTRYVLGGTTTDGFDCSGFTSYVFQQFGVKLARTSDEQFQGGTEVPFEQAQPGDLLFYDSLHKGKVSHVAIYLGDGMIVHANGDDVRLEKEIYMHKIYPFYGVKRYL